jgi:DNA-binding transcriptional ArsR family regulator
MSYQSALIALSDPTRRQVFEQLRHGPKSVGKIAAKMPVSRPAVSQHLGVLKKAGLVGDRAEGSRRVYYIDPRGLAAIRIWLDQFWEDALLAFKSDLGNGERDAQMRCMVDGPGGWTALLESYGRSASNFK